MNGPASSRKTVAEMLADWLREVSALVAVFGVLDELVRNELSIRWLVTTLTFAVSLFALGATVERRRP